MDRGRVGLGGPVRNCLWELGDGHPALHRHGYAQPNTGGRSCCGGNGGTELTAAEEEYFQQVRAAQALSDQIFANFGEIFRQAFPLRERLLTALLEAGVGAAFTGKLAALETIDPPERFQEDHRRLLEATREAARLDAEAAQAVRDDDLVSFVMINGQLFEDAIAGALEISAVFCENASTTPGQSSGCASPESTSGGAYGAQLFELLCSFMPQAASAQGALAFPLSLRPEELGRVISTYAPKTEELFQEFQVAAGKLVPPAEFGADHALLLEYFVESASILREVARLNAAGDPEQAQLEVARLQESFCNARQNFSSSDFKSLVAILFRGEPNTCGGAPF